MDVVALGAGDEARIVGAVITASVAVVVALTTQVTIGLRDRRARRDERQRADLLTLQDAAAALRRRLRAYDRALGRAAGAESGKPVPAVATTGTLAGLDVSLAVPEDVQGALDEAGELFDVHLVRVDEQVQEAARAWRGKAQFRFAQGTDDVTAAAEEEEWDALHEEVRRVLPG